MKIDGLPKGNWVEICDPEEITGEQKRLYQNAIDKMMYPNGSDVVQVPDPENPAVMLQQAPPRARLSAENIQALQDMVFGACIVGWSYDLPLPYTAESLKVLPAIVGDKIETALAPHYADVFNSWGPKEEGTTTTTSASTSPDAAHASPTEPASAPSDGASG